MRDVAAIYLIDLNRRYVWLLSMLAALALVFLPKLITSFDMAGFDRVTKDVGLTLMGMYAVVCALVLGSTAIPQDMERRTLYPVLSRPMLRLHYVLGKFCGIALWIGATMFLLGGALFAGVAAFQGLVDWQIWEATLGYLLQACVLVAMALCISTHAGSIVCAVTSLFIYIIGGLSHLYLKFFLSGGSAWILGLLKRLLPDFELFHVKNAVVHGEPLSMSYVAAMCCYGAAWTALFLVLGGRLFERRDL